MTYKIKNRSLLLKFIIVIIVELCGLVGLLGLLGLLSSPKTTYAMAADMPYQCNQGNIDYCLKACVEQSLTEACMMVVSLMQNNNLERLFAERNYQLQKEKEQNNSPKSDKETDTELGRNNSNNHNNDDNPNLYRSQTLNTGDCSNSSLNNYQNYRKFSALYYLNQHQSIRNYDNINDFKPCRPAIASKQLRPASPDKTPKQTQPKNRSKPVYFIRKIKSGPKNKYLGDLSVKPDKPRQNIYLSKKYAYSRMIKRLHQN